MQDDLDKIAPNPNHTTALPISVYRDLLIRAYERLQHLEPGTPKYTDLADLVTAYRFVVQVFNRAHRN